MNPKRHFRFKCPFCMRKLEPRKGARTCVCGYWVKPVSKNEINEWSKQMVLLQKTKSNYVCQESWQELGDK